MKRFPRVAEALLAQSWRPGRRQRARMTDGTSDVQARSWLSSTQQTASIVRTERTVCWHRLMHRGGCYERVQDRDRAESMAAHVATGGGGALLRAASVSCEPGGGAH